MTASTALRAVFLCPGESPPAGVLRLLQHPEVDLKGVEFDAWLAGLDLQSSPPAMVVAVGGKSFIQNLRRQPQCSCLPIFQWGSATQVEPGWDGALVRWSEPVLAQVRCWQQQLEKFEPFVEADPQDRREHGFLRFLATRGSASTDDAKVFGVAAPFAAFRRWQQRGWCVGSPRHMQATPLLHEVVARAHLQVAEAPPSQDGIQAMPQTPGQGRGWFRKGFHLGLGLLVVCALLYAVGGLDWVLPSPRAAVVVGSTPKPPQPPAAQAKVEPTSSLPELALDAHLVRPKRAVTAPIDGRIQWRLVADSQVTDGATLGVVTQIAGLDRSQRLADLLAQMEQEQQNQRQLAHQQWQQELRLAKADAAALQEDVVDLQRRLPPLKARYEHALELAEQGVYSFRQVQPDHQAYLQLQTRLAEKKQEAARGQQQVKTLEEAGPRFSPQSWEMQRRSLQVQLEEARTSQVRLPVVAVTAGDFHPLLADGDACVAGQEVAQILPQNEGYLEAVLATADWDAAYLQGNARLRRPGLSSWMPTRILEAYSTKEGITRLHLRLPVGWLDDAVAQAAAAQQLLEVRLAAPISVSKSPQATQPNSSSPVESSE